MTRKSSDLAGAKSKSPWVVVVVYENSAARERATSFCDGLVGRLWADTELEVQWWAFEALQEAAEAQTAAHKAADADMIVVSANAEGDFPAGVSAWMQAWLRERGDREGRLVGLLEPAGKEIGATGLRHLQLRNTAHQCAMDYLTDVPPEIALTIPETFDSYTSRACEVTSLLDGILHRPAPPPSLSPPD